MHRAKSPGGHFWGKHYQPQLFSVSLSPQQATHGITRNDLHNPAALVELSVVALFQV